MKENELRVGNVVKYELQQFNYALSIRDILWCSEDNYAFNKTFKPITVEEILLKVGFEKSSMYDNTYFIIIQTLNGLNELFLDIKANVILIGHVEIGSFKYLHQLQNLYFELTGQELNTSGL